jgi:hypothetical protein
MTASLPLSEKEVLIPEVQTALKTALCETNEALMNYPLDVCLLYITIETGSTRRLNAAPRLLQSTLVTFVINLPDDLTPAPAPPDSAGVAPAPAPELVTSLQSLDTTTFADNINTALADEGVTDVTVDTEQVTFEAPVVEITVDMAGTYE